LSIQNSTYDKIARADFSFSASKMLNSFIHFTLLYLKKIEAYFSNLLFFWTIFQNSYFFRSHWPPRIFGYIDRDAKIRHTLGNCFCCIKKVTE